MSLGPRGSGGSSTAVLLTGGVSVPAEAFRMVTVIISEVVALCRSVAVNARMAVVLESTCGAVKVVDGAVWLARVISRAESCDHR